MSYYVIREGKVKGQGRYRTSGGTEPYWTDRLALAERLTQPEKSIVYGDERIVRVTRKPRETELTQENAERVYRDGYALGREAALEEAIRALRKWRLNSNDYRHSYEVIAALRSK